MSGISGNQWSFQVVAHRGFKAHYAENTLVSFQKALEVGATMVELDVRMTKDEVVIILHDPTLLRLGNQKRHVSTMLWETLKAVNLHDKQARHLKSGSILSFEDLLKTFGKSINYYIEIKTSNIHSRNYKENLCRRVVELVARYDLFDHALFVTFDLSLLQYLHDYKASLRLGLNYYKKPLTEEELLILEKLQAILCPQHHLLDKATVAAHHRRHFRVIPWVVNDAERMGELIQWGIDGITTDSPDILVIESKKGEKP